MELTTHEFLQKIKKREKELLLAKANLEVKKELGEVPDIILDRTGKSFDELYHIQEFKKAKTLKEKQKHRKALEGRYREDSIMKFVSDEVTGKNKLISNFLRSQKKRPKAEIEAEYKSDIIKVLIFLIIAIVVCFSLFQK